MDEKDISISEMENIRIHVERLEFYGENIDLKTFVKRELALASVGMSKYISQKIKVEEPKVVDNLFRWVYVDFVEGEAFKFYLLNDSSKVDPNKGYISVESELGKKLRTASVGDVLEVGEHIVEVIKISNVEQIDISATM